jgi:CubicO group peptidase (beta-lactamase class C family)
MMRTVLLSLLVSVFTAPAFAQSAFPSDADMLAMIKARVDEGRAAGIVLGVMDADGMARVVAYGDAGPGAEPLSKNSVFEIGSVTKTFTATLLADMAQKGEVKLDGPAQAYAPAGLTLPARNGKEITLTNLSEQNSGLPRLPGNLTPANPANPYADYTVDQLNDFLNHYTLTRDPGETFEYSNLGVGLLGHLLAARTGTSYEALATERILKPLNMTMTAVTMTPAMKEQLAQGHDAQGRPVGLWDIPTLVGAGGLRSNMTDMLKYLDANVGPPRNDLERAMRLAQQPRAKAGAMRIGLNWFTQKDPSGVEIIWHNGATGGYSAFVGFDQKRGVGVVLLSNSTGGAQDIAFHLLDPAMPLTPKPAAPKERTAITLPQETLAKYAGVYAMDVAPDFKLTVTAEGGALFVQATGQGKAPVYAETETDFFYRIVDAQLSFTPAMDGKPAYVVLHQNGGEQRATKLP